jgi:asparagine synthase (glutamine-hydrolysing)
MCGFAGFVGSNQTLASQKVTLEQMTNSIVHRGPDSSGCWIDSEGLVAIGHRRLAIQDVSFHGAQPMHSEDGRWVLAFNGEIYNHREMRNLLLDQGYQHKWIGQSDTETLLTAIQILGLDHAVSLCVGMFA